MHQSVSRPAAKPVHGEASPCTFSSAQSSEPTFENRSSQDGSLQALAILARLHHVAAEPHALRHGLGLGETDPVSQQSLL